MNNFEKTVQGADAHIGPKPTGETILKSGGDRFLVHGDDLLFYLYEKEKNAVYVMAVFNGKRDYTRVMREFLRLEKFDTTAPML